MHRPRGEAIATDCAQHFGRQSPLVFSEQPEDRRHAADPAGDLGEEFSGRARTEVAEVLSPACEAGVVGGVISGQFRLFP